MRGDAHVRFGGRAEETGRLKDRHRASVRPYPSGSRLTPGRPTVREDQLPGGPRMVQQANAGMSKDNRKASLMAAPSGWLWRITGRIRASARPERELTWTR